MNKDIYIRNAFFAWCAVVLIASGIAFFSLRGVNHLLVIHFSEGGIDFLGTKAEILNVILISVLIGGMNFLLARVFYPRIKLLSYLLSFFSVFIAVLLLIAVGVIISVN